MSKIRLVEIAAEHLQGKEGASLLEIGVGSGGVTRLIMNAFGSRIRYSCCDLRRENVELAESIMMDNFISGYTADFNEWSGVGHKYDAVISDTAINMNHFTLDRFFQSARRCMSIDSAIHIRDLLCPDQSADEYDMFMREYMESIHYKKIDYTFTEIRAIEAAAEKSGFTVRSVEKCEEKSIPLVASQWGFFLREDRPMRGIKSFIMTLQPISS